LGFESRRPTDPREHSRSDFFVVVEREDVIKPADALEDTV
jgi:hypothetical protein